MAGSVLSGGFGPATPLPWASPSHPHSGALPAVLPKSGQVSAGNDYRHLPCARPGLGAGGLGAHRLPRAMRRPTGSLHCRRFSSGSSEAGSAGSRCSRAASSHCQEAESAPSSPSSPVFSGGRQAILGIGFSASRYLASSLQAFSLCGLQTSPYRSEDSSQLRGPLTPMVSCLKQ